MITGPLITAASRLGSSMVTDGDSAAAPSWQPRSAAAAMASVSAAKPRVISTAPNRALSCAGVPVSTTRPDWMITTSLAVTQGAINRKESRGGHTREDYPGPDPELGKVNFVQHQSGEFGWLAPIAIAPAPLPQMPEELRALFEEGK